jgi:hypothetical protein
VSEGGALVRFYNWGAHGLVVTATMGQTTPAPTQRFSRWLCRVVRCVSSGCVSRSTVGNLTDPRC